MNIKYVRFYEHAYVEVMLSDWRKK